MRYEEYRPDAPLGKIDGRLPDVASEFAELLSGIQKEFRYDTLRLGAMALEEVSGVLVDFAADVHCETGLWLAYERHNRELFGTSLPVTGDAGVEKHPRGIGSDRVRHLLWILYPELIPGLVLAPLHRDLLMVTGTVTPYLRKRFLRLARSSCVRRFLAGSNEFGWDVKRKLVWLGTKSFMFRLHFRRYVEEECDGDASIGNIDDFVCQQCTSWSGLGAVDVLAEVLDVSDEDGHTLRSWYERHAAAYRVVSTGPDVVDAVNVYSGARYTIRINLKRPPFKPGQLVLGSLVPWRGEWYWSGTQRVIDNPVPSLIEELKDKMKRGSPGILCRYWKEYERTVREHAARLHQRSLEYHGKDLIVYPDGLSMAADWQKEFRHYLSSLSPEHVAEASKKHDLKDGMPGMNISEELLNDKDGVGVYLNPDEGKEIMRGFTPVLSGLRRKGAGLTDEEADAVRGFVLAEETSPRFVKALVAQHGDESIRAAFMLSGCREDWCLDYLLRRCKGHFYRKRYPHLSVI